MLAGLTNKKSCLLPVVAWDALPIPHLYPPDGNNRCSCCNGPEIVKSQFRPIKSDDNHWADGWEWMAAAATDDRTRAMLMHMADAWVRLAVSKEKLTEPNGSEEH
jgi:hypothetical protein